MINRIKALILGGGAPVPAAGAKASGGGDASDAEAAAVALLVEAAVMDGDFDGDERQVIAGLIVARFGLDAADVEELISAGEQAVEDSNQLFAFTSAVKKGFDFDQRIALIEMLWQVAFADGVLHDFEASLVRRVAGLIHVSDRDSGAARKRVLQRLDEGGAGS
ncbi:MAG: TerB family tellurite resistance protein [Proteobacteria bacterium]|nr:TerB family tellurite resistance protein [Pseudomonadota bacterium]